MRKYTITVFQSDYAVVQDEAYDEVRNPKLGYAGETESTELTINLPSNWTGNFYLDWFYSGAWHEGETAYTDTEITYVTDFTLVPGDTYLRIRIEDGDEKMYCDPIKFVVRV